MLLLLKRDDDLLAHMRPIAASMRLVANQGTTDGRETWANSRYLNHCRHFDRATGTVIIFTRDVGHHTSGWMKNPDYERCYHLSFSFFDPRTGRPRDFDRVLARLWAQACYGDDLRLVWVETSNSPEGRARQVQHWRLFCDRWWRGILPRGEVYSKEFTELGWKTASQVLEEERQLTTRLVDRS